MRCTRPICRLRIEAYRIVLKDRHEKFLWWEKNRFYRVPIRGAVKNAVLPFLHMQGGMLWLCNQERESDG
jgi:hypothetical protein